MNAKKSIQDYFWFACKGEAKAAKAAMPQIFRKYPTKTIDARHCEMDPKVILDINTQIQTLVRKGVLNAVFDEKRQIYVSLSITEEQMREMFPGRYFKQDYESAMHTLLTEYKNAPALTKVISKQETEKELLKTFCDIDKPPQEMTGKTRKFLDTCIRVSEYTEDTFIRNASEECGLGSKGLENKMSLFLKLLFPDEYKEIFEDKEKRANKEEEFERLLNRVHLIKNYRYAIIKGEGIIYFQNGGVLPLTGYGNDGIQLSDNMVKNIQSIECKKLLTIENLTTFNSYPYDFQGLAVFAGGHINMVTERFLKQIENTPHYHSGDMDAYGFEIIKVMERKLNRHIIPYKMDLETYLSRKDKAIDMTPDNKEKFQKMLTEEYSEEEKSLFKKLLEDNKILEQESL